MQSYWIPVWGMITSWVIILCIYQSHVLLLALQSSATTFTAKPAISSLCPHGHVLTTQFTCNHTVSQTLVSLKCFRGHFSGCLSHHPQRILIFWSAHCASLTMTNLTSKPSFLTSHTLPFRPLIAHTQAVQTCI